MMVKSQINSGYSYSLIFGAALSAAGCYWLLFQPARLRSDAIAHLKSDHVVRVRHASQIAWTELKQTDVYDGTLVQVPPHSATTLTVGGEDDTLEADSIVRVTKSGHGIAKEILLKRDETTGRIAYRKTTDLGAGIGLELSQINLLMPVKGLEQDAVTQRQLDHKLARKLEEKLTVNYVSIAPLPPLNFIGSFEDYSIKPTFPPTGALYKAMRAESPCIGFVWSPIPIAGVDYVVEVSKTSTFEFFRSFGARQNYTRLKVNEASDYFWRVRAKRGARSLVGDTSRFTLYKAPLPADELHQQSVARRIRDVSAFLMDVEFCN